MSMLFLQAFVSLRSQHNFNSWYKMRLCQLALSKICNRLIFSLTTASKLLFDTMFQIRYEMKERYLLNIGNSCKGGIKSLSSPIYSYHAISFGIIDIFANPICRLV